ncbi:MAG TPA: CHAD domain-containing protein [Caulobacteraceae bacterium]|nr:CHAD domain-containing protein [Caulobacteraceae bacterium]
MGELILPRAANGPNDEPKTAPANAQEIELKFELEPDALDRLEERLTVRAGAHKPKPAQTLVSTYYDTAGLALQKARVTLRVREDGRRRIQTLKTEGDGLFTRGEWEWPLAKGQALDLEALKATPFAGLAAAHGEDLRPVFATRMKRAKRLIREPAGEVEVALDRGQIEADGRTTGLCELELELKAGKAEALFGLARRLAETEPLRLSFITKAERGFKLLSNTPEGLAPVTAPALDRHMSVAAAFGAIGAQGLRQLAANAQAFNLTRQPDAVHQTRVAIRRLRTAFKLFAPAVRDGEFGRIEDELKWLAGELDQARDLDVMIVETFAPAADRFQDQGGMTELGERLQRTRAQAYERALKAVQGRRFLALTLDLAAWLDGGAWRDPDGPHYAERAGAPVRAFAREGLDRLRRRIKRGGKDLHRLSPDQRHKLRISVKRLRYAQEFFGALFGEDARRRAFLATLKDLQEVLGQLNDLEVAREQGLSLAETGGRAAGDTAREGARQAFAAGLMIGVRARGEGALLKRSIKLYDRFAKAEPFWRD